MFIFIISFQRLNPAELLRLYLDYDLLSEAANLAVEYIKATLGAGKEYFGLTVSNRYHVVTLFGL